MKLLTMIFLIVGLFCIVLQGCAAALFTPFDDTAQPIITMTPGSWR